MINLKHLLLQGALNGLAGFWGYVCVTIQIKKGEEFERKRRDAGETGGGRQVRKWCEWRLLNGSLKKFDKRIHVEKKKTKTFPKHPLGVIVAPFSISSRTNRAA